VIRKLVRGLLGVALELAVAYQLAATAHVAGRLARLELVLVARDDDLVAWMLDKLAIDLLLLLLTTGMVAINA